MASVHGSTFSKFSMQGGNLFSCGGHRVGVKLRKCCGDSEFHWVCPEGPHWLWWLPGANFAPGLLPSRSWHLDYGTNLVKFILSVMAPMHGKTILKCLIQVGILFSCGAPVFE